LNAEKTGAAKLAAKSPGRDNRQKKPGQELRQTVPFRPCPAETARVKS
jgi:hypothetical protein